MTSVNAPSLTARLRKAIAFEHDAIEKTPFSLALMAGGLSRHEYSHNLSQMYRIHQTIENAATDYKELRPFFAVEMVRAPVIERDLKQLGVSLDDFAFEDSTRSAVAHIETAVADQPLTLIGGIYVLEGSRMGSMVLAKPLAKCLGVSGAPNTGIDYHVEGARQTPARLKQWKEVVDNTDFGAAVADAIESFAVQLMRSLLAIYSSTRVNGAGDKRVA